MGGIILKRKGFIFNKLSVPGKQKGPKEEQLTSFLLEI